MRNFLRRRSCTSSGTPITVMKSLQERMSTMGEGEEEKEAEEDHQRNVWDCGSPLYDSYELVAISHVIDRHMIQLHGLTGSIQNGPTESNQPKSEKNVTISKKQGRLSFMRKIISKIEEKLKK